MSSEPTLPAILDLAQRQGIEKSQFTEFLANLRSTLRDWRISFEGRRGALAEYLNWRKAESSVKVSDEQPVVDPLVRKLLEALGYREGDFTYNERLPELLERAVPDFTVRVEEFLGSLPVFVVEDKSTAVRDFKRRRRAGGEEESPIEQLRRYVLSGAVHGRIGLLCNGWLLESWEFGAEGDTRLVQIDLHALALGASGEEQEFPGRQREALQALWSRFSRPAFVRASEHQTASISVPPLPPDSVARMSRAFSLTGRPQDMEQELVSYYEQVWRDGALDVRFASESLVESLRGLIDQFAEDVLHQLDDSLRRYDEYEKERRLEEEGSQLPGLRQLIALRQQSFDLSREDFEKMLLQPLDAWCQRPRLEEVEDQVGGWIEALTPHLKVTNGPVAHQMNLGQEARPGRAAKARTWQDNGKARLIKSLAEDLRKVCRQALDEFAAHQQLDESYRTSLRVARAYQTWVQRVSSSVLVGQPEPMFRREFARQTAYVYIVRLLLVRICEDKGLFRRKLSDGGLVLWQERVSQYLDYASGRSYEYLTKMAYECAQNVYVHFYGASELFDWYRMDDKMLLRALLVLNAFNLARIDTDIIGAVYGRYLKEGKHEQGRYYTPKPLVSKMLDLAGYDGEQIVQRKIADLACGSGSFLVEACRRLLAQFQGKDGTIPKAKIRPALEEIQRSIYGMDINPFACYLAETNLLIQVLDLIRRAKDEGITLAVDRFRIYCEDSLIVDEALVGASEASIFLLGQDKATAELLKGRSGPFQEGFDFLIGNPPYVRADEDAPAYLAYRRRLERQGWFTTRHLKWDLYVPFVEQYQRLLSDAPEARCCLVTIESISNAPYAAKLREFLARQATLHEILFTKGLKLFEDAKWQDNIVFVFSRGAPSEGHRVQRTISQAWRSDGSLVVEEIDRAVQMQVEPDRLFSIREEVHLDFSDTVLLEEVCYITKGMVLHSTERLQAGEIVNVPAEYDPARFGEELVEDLGEAGKRIRHRPFNREDLISDSKDDLHARPYLDSRQVLRGGIGRIRWLEYGSQARCPSFVSRATFAQLFELPKLMFGAFTGIAVDVADVGGDYLMSPHNVRIGILWSNLVNIDNRALLKARTALEKAGNFDSTRSQLFSEWFICALTLSEPMQSWLYAKRRSMKDDVYPDDVKSMPIKVLSMENQRPFIVLEQERHRLWRELTAREDQGFKIGSRVQIPVHRLAESFRLEHQEVEHLKLYQLPSSLVEFQDAAYDRELRKARSVGAQLMVKNEVVARVGEKVAAQEEVGRILALFLSHMPGTLADRQDLDQLPRSEAGLLALAEYLREQEEEVRGRQARIEAIQREIDERAWQLYRP